MVEIIRLLLTLAVVPVFLAVPNFLAIEVKPRFDRGGCSNATEEEGAQHNVTEEARNATEGGAAAEAGGEAKEQWIVDRSCLAQV